MRYHGVKHRPHVRAALITPAVDRGNGIHILSVHKYSCVIVCILRVRSGLRYI
jgi:hypothetical protein